MEVGLFKKTYTVRKHGEQAVNAGYASAPYGDVAMRLNVQRLRPDELLTLPEGKREVVRLKAFGPGELAAADERGNTPADMLHYRGQWYECVSSFLLDNTPLMHYRSEFVLLPPNRQPGPPQGGGGP